MARRQNDNNCNLDFIFKTPRKLYFTRLYRFYFDFILRLLYRVIVFENIPETVSETFMKLILYTQGKICFFKGDKIGESGSALLALNCSRADTPDVYYIPRKVLITNPRLKKSYNIEPGKDCEIVYLSEADKYNLAEVNGGLYALIERTAVMLADNDISINISQKNTRLTNLVSGDTQNTVDSIKAVICAMYEGDPTIVVKSSLIDKLQGIPIINNTSTNQNLVQLIEVQQYILSHFYEQIGITTHDQMKRERLITAEINDNLDLAFLNIDDILESVQEGLQRVNSMFGTNIEARLNDIIQRQREKADSALLAAAGGNLPENADEETGEDPTPDGSEEQPTGSDQPEEAADDQPEEAAEDQAEEAAEDQGEEAAEDQTEKAADDQAEDAAEDQTEEAADDQTEDAADDQTVNINIEGDNNIIVVGGEDVGTTKTDELSDMGSDSDE